MFRSKRGFVAAGQVYATRSTCTHTVVSIAADSAAAATRVEVYELEEEHAANSHQPVRLVGDSGTAPDSLGVRSRSGSVVFGQSSSAVPGSYRVSPSHHGLEWSTKWRALASSADEAKVTFIGSTNLPTEHGDMLLRAYEYEMSCVDADSGRTDVRMTKEAIAIVVGVDVDGLKETGEQLHEVPLRVHDECWTSEVLGSLKCDCRAQLHRSLQYFKEGIGQGVVIYLQQEGRGIGLARKIAAYGLQEQGFDTVDANLHLGLPAEARRYECVAPILRDLQVQSVRLVTNNPYKIQKIRETGVDVRGRVPIVIPPNAVNKGYLDTKMRRMGHLLPNHHHHHHHDHHTHDGTCSHHEHHTHQQSSDSAAAPAAAVRPSHPRLVRRFNGRERRQLKDAFRMLQQLTTRQREVLRAAADQPRDGQTAAAVKLPFCLLTYAQSVCGSIGVWGAGGVAMPLGLSGPLAHQMTHSLRGIHDAILVGVGTVLSDDPRLTTRLAVTSPFHWWCRHLTGSDEPSHPRPVIVDSSLRLADATQSTALLHEKPSGQPPIILTTKAGLGFEGGASDDKMRRRQALEAAGSEVVVCASDEGGRVDLADGLRQLGRAGITSVMVEGGGSIISSMVAASLAHHCIVTVSPQIVINGVRLRAPLSSMGGGHGSETGASHMLQRSHIFRLGNDTIFSGRLNA
ncbi:unnamed protein product [Vitrella brassicaformis CCMP3155]|uniref:GTP cyclohydrolase II n=1 Tax=Vitrella brassicaformis (strain CCMP3155) TaxID=1169540 RepID=A0A0G4EHW6_VITBC|nr:unnamed protein product [Vitrella brassicaformis CCMP3155]|eukprot:CEL95810.1 unnamed protein product [Vitrella brassicaformis CCMP3155]